MESRGQSVWNGASRRAGQMQKIDFDGLAPLLPAVYISDIVQRHYSAWAGTQEHSLSVPEFYCECHDIFHRNSTISCNSANMTESLLCAKYSGRSWRQQSESRSILIHKGSQLHYSLTTATRSDNVCGQRWHKVLRGLEEAPDPAWESRGFQEGMM